MNLDDFGINIGSKMFEHYEILQPQLAGIAENWSNTFGLSNLGVNNNYSQLISEMKSAYTPEVMGIASAIDELSDLTASLRESISYSGLSRMVEAIQSSVPVNMDLESLGNTVAGLSRIFDDDFRIKLGKSIQSLSALSFENTDMMDDFLESISEEDYEGFSIDEQGSLVCDGKVLTIEEVRQIIFDCLNNAIDWIKSSKIKFETKHKIACFVIGTYIDICVVIGISPVQPVSSAVQKAISIANNFNNTYYVSEESAKVYTDPDCTSKIICRLSYGDTVISEENGKGWIKISAHVGDEVYQGWIAKRNLISYEKAKFHPDELEHEIE